MINAFEGIRDFIILHYKATKRTDTPFWDRVREMPIPTSLRERVELFRESGRFVRDENELFSLESWILVMLGQGIVPERYSPLVDAIDDVLANFAEKEIRTEITDAVRSMPTHEVYLRSLSKTVGA